MRIVSTSYINTSTFNDPEAWLERIGFYTGILERLAEKHQVESIEQINYKGRLIRKGVSYHFLNFKKPKQYFPVRLHDYISKLSPDVVFINGLVFPLQVLQLRRKLDRSVRIIMIHRSELPFNGIKKILQRWADRYVDAYIFSSGEFGDIWIRNGNINDERKIAEIIHGSSSFHVTDKLLARSTLSIKGSPVFLWVGRLDANKDPLTLVRAFIRFHAIQPSARLYMIYQKDELIRELVALIEDKKAVEAVHLVGKVSHKELQNWYSAADFIVSGSYYEGNGIAVCEAMSCGCIPVVTNIISFRSMTGRGKCGLLYEPGNEEDLLRVLLETREINMEEERAKVLQQFKEELSFEAIAEKINVILIR